MKKYRSGNIEVMVMDPSDKKTWWGISDYLNRYNKDLKEEGWRIPSANEMTYLYDIFGLEISGIKSGEYWTSNVYNEDSNGDPISCLVFVFSPFRSSRDFTDYMPCIIRGTMSVKLPVILVKGI